MKIANKARTAIAIPGMLLLATFAVVFAAPQFSAAASAKNGEATFGQKCAMCHAKDGSGNTPMGKNLKLRDLSSKQVQAQTHKQLYDIIANGKSPMPGYASQLSKADIEDLVAFIRAMAKEK